MVWSVLFYFLSTSSHFGNLQMHFEGCRRFQWLQSINLFCHTQQETKIMYISQWIISKIKLSRHNKNHFMATTRHRTGDLWHVYSSHTATKCTWWPTYIQRQMLVFQHSISSYLWLTKYTVSRHSYETQQDVETRDKAKTRHTSVETVPIQRLANRPTMSQDIARENMYVYIIGRFSAVQHNANNISINVLQYRQTDRQVHRAASSQA